MNPFEAWTLVEEVKKILEVGDLDKDNYMHEFESQVLYSWGLIPEPLIGPVQQIPVGETPAPAAGAAPSSPTPAKDASAKEKKVDKGPPPKEEVKGIANIKLVSFPEGSKMNVLKEIRKLKPGMNLADSMKLVANLPQILIKGVSPEEQTKWKTELEKTGAVLEFV